MHPIVFLILLAGYEFSPRYWVDPMNCKRPGVECIYPGCVWKFYSKSGMLWHLKNHHKTTKKEVITNQDQIVTESEKVSTDISKQKRYYLRHRDEILKDKQFKDWDKKNTSKSKSKEIASNGVNSSNEGTSQ